MTSHQGQGIKDRRGTHGPPVPSNLVQFRLLFTKLRHFEKNDTRNFSLIGRHLESVSRTIPVFKHTLAPIFYRVIVLTTARCNLCARAKVKGHMKVKIEENTSVGELVEPFQIW